MNTVLRTLIGNPGRALVTGLAVVTVACLMAHPVLWFVDTFPAECIGMALCPLLWLGTYLIGKRIAAEDRLHDADMNRQ